MIHTWQRPVWDALTGDPQRLPHALLLSGPEGIGKLDLAREAARWLLCREPGPAGGCGQCQSCHWFAQGSHPDFKLIEPQTDDDDKGEKNTREKGAREKAIGVDAIRVLGEFVGLSAHQHGWRVVVISPAERMNAAAANALLKTLEEPPPHVLLILVSHHPRRLLPTVRSRCRQIALGRPARDEALAYLAEQGIAAAENVLDEAGGAPLLALTYAGPERQERRARFLQAVSRPTPEAMLDLAQAAKDDLAETWGWLERWLHDVIAVRTGIPARYFPAEAGLSALAPRADLPALLALQSTLTRDARWLNHPLNTQLVLEGWLLAYARAFRRRS